jgi:hypothetical protein
MGMKKEANAASSARLTASHQARRGLAEVLSIVVLAPTILFNANAPKDFSLMPAALHALMLLPLLSEGLVLSDEALAAYNSAIMAGLCVWGILTLKQMLLEGRLMVMSKAQWQRVLEAGF